MTSFHKHILNTPSELVVDSLKGLAYLNPSIALDEQHRVIYQRNQREGTVALISGGGSGHEPAHASFVGTGILSAAVAGSVFASPNISQIRRAINIVSSSPSNKGVLLVVKNYTGDVLHFGLASEQHRASSQGHKTDVRVVIVGDDVSVGRTQGGLRTRGNDISLQNCRGLAYSGATIDQVESLANMVANNVATFGVPGTKPGSSYLNADELELGMGIHNEPGHTRLRPYPPAKELVATMLESITSTIETDPERGFLSHGLKKDGKDEVVLLVNNLGAVSQLELGVIVKEAIAWLRNKKFIVKRVLSGTYMTSLNMPGYSLTILLLPRGGSPDSKIASATEILDLLDAPSDAPGWIWYSKNDLSHIDVSPAPPFEDLELEERGQVCIRPSNSGAFVAAIERAANALIAAEPEITKQDTIAGDGDAGLTLKAGAEGILRATKDQRIRGVNIISDLRVVSEVVDATMGGTSGALYSIYFSALTSALRRVTEASPETDYANLDVWASAAKEALKALYQYTLARPPSRTLIDPLAAFTLALQSPSSESFPHAVEEARKAAEQTRTLEARAGRGAYVNQQALTESRVPDPGAWGVWIILNALLVR
ncbi:Dak1 domain-containing protein [Cantharellus anzutake]|uniref:Dak1 domain-containing protein n=1 Tax=Cantharellus anzutake TaxID=1750568 RepID=UPI001905CC4E|nr:Dak1 domain-containing protein [Cantharellus anzutake]KAF8332086.1 Dak1 domain-containing protein [Cantharellus anzutake]